MPGFIITESSTLVCPHASGTARALLTDAHVKISGSAIMTVQLPYQIDHCGNTNAPCVTASWIVGAGRVQASGQSVAINTGVSEVKPAGALSPILVQGTVSAS
jgi:hypothetical protein